MSTASEGALPERSGVRVTDDDRQRTIARLRTAAGEGAIDLDELEQRIAAAWQARTVAELEVVTHDLPATIGPPGPAPVGGHRRPLVLEDDEFRTHLTTYCLVIGMLVVIWLLAGGPLSHPWPIYPALGWGIGLGSHHQVAVGRQRKRLARARALGISLEELEIREEEERGAKRRSTRDGAGRMVARASEMAAEHTRRGLEVGRKAQEASMGRPAGAGPRFVVAMFVDVVASTALNEALGDVQWAAVRKGFHTLVDHAATAHGGWQVSTSGDGVLLRFEQPQGAAEAAVQLLRRLEQQRDQTGFAPSVRIGIHSGDAMEDGDDIIGNVVNLACRVSETAEPDQVLVTEHVADHLDGRLRSRGTGLHTLKGIARPRHLLTLDWR